MSMQDPIASMICCIRNAQQTAKKSVRMYSSKIKVAIAKILKDEGYVTDYRTLEENGKKYLEIDLKYYQGKPVIEMMKRVSKPGLRIYKSCDELPKVMGGLGISIISTSKGLLSDRAAKAARQGGEVIAEVA